MQPLSFWKKSFYSALIFFATLSALSIGYSNFVASYPASVGTGSGLSSTEWNKMVGGLQTLDTNLSNFSFSGGNVGVGIIPSYKMDVSIGAGNSGVIQRWSAPSYESVNLGIDASKAWLGTVSTTPLTFRVQDTERMRIDPSGNLIVGATSGTYRGVFNGTSSFGGLRVNTPGSGLYWPVYLNDTDATAVSQILVDIRRNDTRVGYISTTNTTTNYATSSDYRLKTNVEGMTGALDRIMSLHPDTYRWKSDDSYGEGFLAHELQQVVPIAVSGTKDAVDKNGNPVYQAVDYGKLTPVLTAGIQELERKVTALEAIVCTDHPDAEICK